MKKLIVICIILLVFIAFYSYEDENSQKSRQQTLIKNALLVEPGMMANDAVKLVGRPDEIVINKDRNIFEYWYDLHLVDDSYPFGVIQFENSGIVRDIYFPQI